MHKLSIYIKQNVPEPEGEVKKDKWYTERSIVSLLMKQTLTEESVYQTLVNNGWEPTEKNPYVTYQKVLKAVPKVSPEAEFDLLVELGTLKRRNFETLHKLIVRIQFVRKRLMKLGNTMDERNYVMFTMNAVKDVYPTEYMFWMRDFSNNSMKWNRLMEELSTISNKEKHSVSMTALNTPKSTSATASQATSRNNNKSECPHPGCEKKIYSNMNHYEYRRHYPGNCCW